MEEGEVQIFFLIATIISFLSRNSSARYLNENNRTFLGPYYGLQIMHLFSLLIENVSKERLEVLQLPFIIFNDHTSTPHIISLILDGRSR